MMRYLVNLLRNSEIFSRLFHTIGYCVKSELKDCESVLDLGCGPNSVIQFSKHIKYSVGVDAFDPYLKQIKKRKLHTKYIKAKIQDIKFPKKSFDAVIMIEVLEHMSKRDGLRALINAEKWAKKKIIITTPNGYFRMGEVDDNLYQKHISGWTAEELSRLGFRCSGVTGAKFMYSEENHVHSLNEGFGFSNMRFNPKPLSFIINAFLQLIVYYFPNYAFELFAIKKMNKHVL